jgi:hypothetical protein
MDARAIETSWIPKSSRYAVLATFFYYKSRCLHHPPSASTRYNLERHQESVVPT